MCELARGQRSAALVWFKNVLEGLARNVEVIGPQHIMDGIENPGQVFVSCGCVLSACGDARYEEPLNQAYDFIQARAAKTGDSALRVSFLEKVNTVTR